MADIDVLGDDDAVERVAVGPGRRRHATGPVLDVYADGPIDRHCRNCGAEPLQFCRHPNGGTRVIPCPTR